MDNIDNQIIDLIIKKTEMDRSLLAPEVELTEVGLDSLDLIELVFDIEDKFSIDIPFNANASSDDPANAAFSTVGDLLAVVRQIIIDKESTKSTAI